MNQPTNDTNEPIRLILTPDEFAVLLLNTYQGGEYAYEEGETKTDAQKYQKRVLKEDIIKLQKGGDLFRLCNAMIEAMSHHEEPIRLRQENKLLRAYKKAHDDKKGNERDSIRALYLDEIRQEIRDDVRAECQDTEDSLRRNGVRYRACIDKLEKSQEHYKNNMVSKEAYEIMTAENYSLSNQLYELQMKTRKSSKQLMKEKLQKQMDDLENDSEDDTISSD
tara:strand:- start:999 stop:1664 length:666 start_codon:yes stop_codon:yes gene_type:complete